MVDEGKVDGSGVCIFEMTERVGGRLFSLRGLGPVRREHLHMITVYPDPSFLGR